MSAKLAAAAVPLFLLALAGCAAPVAEPLPAPTVLDIPTAYTAKVPGRWALAVASPSLNAQVAAPGFACGGMVFPVDLDLQFHRYLEQGFRQVADDVTPVDHPLTREELRVAGFSGQIIVHDAVLAPDVSFQQDGIHALVDSNLRLSAIVDAGTYHRVSTANGISHADVGLICQHGSNALALAADNAMQQVAIDAAAAFDASADIRLAASR
ncbi:MAG TPA: hypothetical protein VG387_15700 [Rhizomicrobium sp.]|jgi:hypothetical protein|nr:hypothetical protein [Rhizomicrobium sp.]